jgi:hypothetical protein
MEEEIDSYDNNTIIVRDSNGHDTEKKYHDTILILQILSTLYPIRYYTVLLKYLNTDKVSRYRSDASVIKMHIFMIIAPIIRLDLRCVL